MPLTRSILNLPDFKIREINKVDPVIIEAEYVGKVECPSCSSKLLRIKDTFIRKIRHVSIGTRASFLNIKSHKFKCLSCSKYFNQIFPGVLKYKRSTEAFRKEVFEKHSNGICQTSLSLMLNIGSATIERWYRESIKKKLCEKKNDLCPRVMGIDEHFFTKKQGYATTICDLGKHRVFDVTLGRSEASLSSYLNRLQGKDNVKVILMDLAEPYRAIAKKYFPNAKIVTDRFHVIRLINIHFLKVWQQIDPDGRRNRGLLSLMRRHKKNLSEKQTVNLYQYFAEHPGLREVYEFKQELTYLLLIKRQTAIECKKLIPVFLDYIEKLKNGVFEPMVTLGKTLDSWKEEVIRMWRFTKSNGITEGFHTKMEMISRRAFGFRNFENYRLRVKYLCA